MGGNVLIALGAGAVTALLCLVLRTRGSHLAHGAVAAILTFLALTFL